MVVPLKNCCISFCVFSESPCFKCGGMAEDLSIAEILYQNFVSDVPAIDRDGSSSGGVLGGVSWGTTIRGQVYSLSLGKRYR